LHVLSAIETADGYRLEYRIWPAQRGAHATIVLLNGVMSHSEWFDPLAGLLSERGFKVVGADRRGTGTNTKDRGDAPSAKALVDDVRAIIERERAPGAPVHLLGWCWGGVLAINVAFEAKGELASLMLVAPGLFSTEALKTKMAEQDPNAAFFESPIEEEMFTTGPALEHFIRRDERRTQQISARFHQIMQKMGMSAQIRLPKLELPILLLLAEHDRATDNAATLRAFERLAKERLTIETLKSAHGMQFEVAGALADAIARFTER
jgi:alpha-beta hydrolase superfamily lysophospholipase